MANTFSETWFSVFLDTIPAAHTDAEVAFICRAAPVAQFPRLLDVCCGPGRHAIPLARAGYEILGVDRDEKSIARARSAAPASARFECLDVRQLDEIRETFDVALILWQSFGFFDESENLRLLRSIAAHVREGGRFIIDLYNREYFAKLPLTDVSERGGRRIHTTRAWRGNRFTSTVRYDDGAESDESEWTLYSPEEFVALAASAGFRELLSCVWHDERRPVTHDEARMQFLFECP